MGRGSPVDIATVYGLDGPGIESRWGVRFFAPVQTGPGGHPASCARGTGSFPGVKSGRGVTLPSPLLVPWSGKSRAIPLPIPTRLIPLWTVQPVQSHSACTTVHFTFTYTCTPPMDRTACTEPQCLYNGAPYFFTPCKNLMDKVALEQVFFVTAFVFSSVSIFPPVLHTHPYSYVYYRH